MKNKLTPIFEEDYQQRDRDLKDKINKEKRETYENLKEEMTEVYPEDNMPSISFFDRERAAARELASEEGFFGVRESDPEFKKELRNEINRIYHMLYSDSENDKFSSTVIARLVKIANSLDDKGLTEEADLLDTIISGEL